MPEKVLLVRNAAKNDFGGAETYQVSIAQILNKFGYYPIIVTNSTRLKEYAAANDIAIIGGLWWSQQNWSGSRVLMFPIYIIWQLILTIWYINLLLKTEATIIHLQSKDDFIAGSIAAYILKRKAIWTDHMDLRYIFENISQPFRNPVGKLVLWSARFSNHIILISKNEYNLVTSHFKNTFAYKQKITIVNNGVIDKVKDYSTKDSDDSVFSFCIASRIVTNKGIGEAIEAFKLLQEKQNNNTSTRLDIYGDGSELSKFKEIAQNNQSIIFHGHQTDAIEKIASSNVFILPSYQEGFSIALLEATMLGKAIIASNVDSNPEIIKDKKTGLLVPARDPEHLSEAMNTLIVNTRLKESLERNARNNFEANFNLESIVREKIITLYED